MSKIFQIFVFLVVYCFKNNCDNICDKYKCLDKRCIEKIGQGQVSQKYLSPDNPYKIKLLQHGETINIISINECKDEEYLIEVNGKYGIINRKYIKATTKLKEPKFLVKLSLKTDHSKPDVISTVMELKSVENNFKKESNNSRIKKDINGINFIERNSSENLTNTLSMSISSPKDNMTEESESTNIDRRKENAKGSKKPLSQITKSSKKPNNISEDLTKQDSNTYEVKEFNKDDTRNISSVAKDSKEEICKVNKSVNITNNNLVTNTVSESKNTFQTNKLKKPSQITKSSKKPTNISEDLTKQDSNAYEMKEFNNDDTKNISKFKVSKEEISKVNKSVNITNNNLVTNTVSESKNTFQTNKLKKPSQITKSSKKPTNNISEDLKKQDSNAYEMKEFNKDDKRNISSKEEIYKVNKSANITDNNLVTSNISESKKTFQTDEPNKPLSQITKSLKKPTNNISEDLTKQDSKAYEMKEFNKDDKRNISSKEEIYKVNNSANITDNNLVTSNISESKKTFQTNESKNTLQDINQQMTNTLNIDDAKEDISPILSNYNNSISDASIGQIIRENNSFDEIRKNESQMINESLTQKLNFIHSSSTFLKLNEVKSDSSKLEENVQEIKIAHKSIEVNESSGNIFNAFKSHDFNPKSKGDLEINQEIDYVNEKNTCLKKEATDFDFDNKILTHEHFTKQEEEFNTSPYSSIRQHLEKNFSENNSSYTSSINSVNDTLSHHVSSNIPFNSILNNVSHEKCISNDDIHFFDKENILFKAFSFLPEEFVLWIKNYISPYKFIVLVFISFSWISFHFLRDILKNYFASNIHKDEFHKSQALNYKLRAEMNACKEKLFTERTKHEESMMALNKMKMKLASMELSLNDLKEKNKQMNIKIVAFSLKTTQQQEKIFELESKSKKLSSENEQKKIINQELEEKIKNLIKKSEELKKHLGDLTQKHDRLQGENDEMKQNLKSLNEKESYLLDEKYKLKAELNNSLVEIKNLKLLNSDKKKEIEVLKDILHSNKNSRINVDANEVIDYTRLKMDLSAAEKKNDTLNLQLNELLNEKNLLNNSYLELVSAKQKLEESCNKVNKEKQEIESKLQTLEEYFNERESKLQSELFELRLKNDEEAKQYDIILKNFEELQKTKASLQDEKDSLLALMDGKEIQYNSKLKETQKKYHKAWASAKHFEKELERIKAECDFYKAKLENTLKRSNDIKGNILHEPPPPPPFPIFQPQDLSYCHEYFRNGNTHSNHGPSPYSNKSYTYNAASPSLSASVVDNFSLLEAKDMPHDCHDSKDSNI